MIDDGKHDPPEIKIENHPWSLAQFDLWEQELQTSREPKKLITKWLWSLIEGIGRSYGGGF